MSEAKYWRELVERTLYVIVESLKRIVLCIGMQYCGSDWAKISDRTTAIYYTICGFRQQKSGIQTYKHIKI